MTLPKIPTRMAVAFLTTFVGACALEAGDSSQEDDGHESAGAGAQIVDQPGSAGTGAEADPGSPVVGTWGLLPNDMLVCADAVDYRANGTFVEIFGCELNSGTTGAILFAGSYHIDGSRLSMRVEESSCRTLDGFRGEFQWSVSGDRLTLVDSRGAFIYTRLDTMESMSNGRVIDFGCFDRDNVFTPAEVLPIQ